MTREEIEAKIEDLKERMFYLDMKDRWSNDDYARSRQMYEEVSDLKKQLTEM